MSFGNAILVAFCFVSYALGLSGTICGHAEHTIYSLADVAHQQRFELAFHSSDPEWYREGMQIFAYTLAGPRWNKRDITWGIEQDSQTISKDKVIKVARVAFEKWSEQSSLNFKGPVAKPDIRIKFVPRLDKIVSNIEYIGLKGGIEGMKTHILDAEGARITINDAVNWRDPREGWFCNIGFTFLQQIGHCLGLGYSNIPDAAMQKSRAHIVARYHIYLAIDDIDGIKKLYGPPSSRKPWGTSEPQPPASSSAQSSSSSSYSDEPPDTDDTDTDTDTDSDYRRAQRDRVVANRLSYPISYPYAAYFLDM